jgi:hypothetical protein
VLVLPDPGLRNQLCASLSSAEIDTVGAFIAGKWQRLPIPYPQELGVKYWHTAGCVWKYCGIVVCELTQDMLVSGA